MFENYKYWVISSQDPEFSMGKVQRLSFMEYTVSY